MDKSTPEKALQPNSDNSSELEISPVSSTGSINEEKLIRVLEIIQSSSVKTKEVYKGLTYVRTKIVDSPDGVSLLKKVNGTKCLLKMLNHSDENIINITLSILGNLCNHLIMNEEFRDEISKCKTPWRLVHTLRKVNKPNIQKRLCRFIGNLAQAHSIGRELQAAGVTHAIVHVLNESEDTELQHMAIRALRWLWQVDKHHLDMLKAGVIKSVANLVSSKDPNVEKAVWRALVKFTQHCTIFTSEQIAGKGDGFTKIVEKIDETAVAVLISNLSHDPRARIELCKAGIVEAIINRLAEGKTNPYLITGLCQMCRESMVRASLRSTENGFKTVLSLLMNQKNKHFYPELLDAIAQFNYDQTSLMMMVRLGLIGVLIEKLAEFTRAHCIRHSDAVASENMGPMSPVSPSHSWANSPSPPPLSPPARTTSSQGDYSPRCTTPTSDSDCSSGPVMERPLVETLAGLDGCILEIISHLTYQGSPMRALAAKMTINTFLDYLTGLPYPRFRQNYVKATRALESIVTCKHYWNTILDDESVLDIHGRLCRPIHEDCWECKRLQLSGESILEKIGFTAQSGLGKGEITYRLTGVSSGSKYTTALTIPHVISQPSLLQYLLFNLNSLRILLEMLSTRIDEAVPSLHSLFSTIAIKNPQQPIQMCSSCEIGSIRKESNIRFTLDDGSTVTANKESLSHSCPVFEAMFRGGFKESLQSAVRLSDISAGCLSHLTRILPEYCSCALPKELPILLEMISVTDRFLLPDLTNKVFTVVRDSALSHSTAFLIYDWGLTLGPQYDVTADISNDVVKFLFTAEMLSSQRVGAVSRILESENRERFLEDITAIVKTGLTKYTESQRFLNFKNFN